MSGSKNAVEIVCVCCDELGRHGGRRLIQSCYNRYLEAGTLDEYPKVGASTLRLGREEDYAELRARGFSVRKAANRLGVTARSGQRYEQRLKARQAVNA